jgi:hypothetical protein
VESQLRRELASELRAHAADEVAALRTELNALRTSLEILFDTDLQQRPALGTFETEAPRAYDDWERNGEGNPVDWVASDRVTSAREDNPPGRNDVRADDTAIIDVPEEPLLPPRPAPPPPEPARPRYEVPRDVPYVVSQEPPYMAQPPEPEPRFEPLHRQPPPPAQTEPQPQVQDWQPVAADGQWSPPETPGSHPAAVDRPSGRRRARHAEEPFDGSPEEPAPSWPYEQPGRRARARHSAEYRDYGVGNFAPDDQPPPAPPLPPPFGAPEAAAPPSYPAPPHMAPAPSPEPTPRHRGADAPPDGYEPEDGPPSGGQSVADLLARLQVQPSGGGRRRRREG